MEGVGILEYEEEMGSLEVFEDCYPEVWDCEMESNSCPWDCVLDGEGYQFEVLEFDLNPMDH